MFSDDRAFSSPALRSGKIFQNPQPKPQTPRAVLPLMLTLTLAVVALLLFLAYYAWRRQQDELAKYYEDLEAAQRERTRLADEAAARLAERRAQIEEERRAALQLAWSEMGVSTETQKRELAKREAAEQARSKARNLAKERKAKEAELRAAQQAAWKSQLAASNMVDDGNGGFVYSYEDASGGEKHSPETGNGMTGKGQQLARTIRAKAQLQSNSSHDADAAMAARIAQIEAAQAAAQAEAEAAYREEMQAAALSRAAQAEQAGKLQARMAAQRLKDYRTKQDAEEAAANALLLDEQRTEEMIKHRDIKAHTPTLSELRATPPALHFQPAASPQRLGTASRKQWLPSAGWKTKEAIKAESEQGGHVSPRPRPVPIAKAESASEWLRSWFSNRGSSPSARKTTAALAGGDHGGDVTAAASPNKYRELVNKYSCS